MHDPEQKAHVVGMIAAGHGINETARLTGVPKATVIRWRDETIGPNAERSIDRSKLVLDWLPLRGDGWQDNFQRYIDDVLYGLRVQVAYLSRPEVLERTDYAAIVDAHGTLADRVARIAEAVGHIDTPASPTHQLDGAAA